MPKENPKKKLTRNEQIEDVRAKLDRARQQRLRTAAAAAQPAAETPDARGRFQEFWAQNKRAYGRVGRTSKDDRDFEDILWVHLKSIKCTNPKDFAKGVEHFGLRRA